jgi:hypothetical protein
MFDHCTTGLRCARLKNEEFSIITLTLILRSRDLRLFLFFSSIFDAVAFLRALYPLLAAPQGLHYGILVFQEPSSAEDLIWVVVGVVTGAVSAEPFNVSLSFHPLPPR